jgi:hypothetical protein
VKDVLPKSEARKLREARKYLDDQRFKWLKESFYSLHDPEPCYGYIDFTIRHLRKYCEPANGPVIEPVNEAVKYLALKLYDMRIRGLDESIKEKMEQIEKATSPEMKASLTGFMRIMENTKEVARKETREYGVEITG